MMRATLQIECDDCQVKFEPTSWCTIGYVRMYAAWRRQHAEHEGWYVNQVVQYCPKCRGNR